MPDGSVPLPQPTIQQLAELQALHQAGRYLDAHVFCQQLAPLTMWRGAPALVLAGRLVNRWGHGPLSNRLHLQAYRTDPADSAAVYYHAFTKWSKHGAFEALQFTTEQARSLPAEPETRHQAYFWLLHARLLGVFRDFSSAEPILARVSSRFTEDPWVWVDKADFLESQDRYGEAYDAITEALRLQPWYCPAVQGRAHLLQLLERDGEAVDLLRTALDHVQSGIVVKMLVSLLEEAGRLDELPPLLDLADRYLPMPDRADQSWLAARRCMAAHRGGNLPLALQWARTAAPHSPYYQKIGERLVAASSPAPRVHLPVGFVRQHHMTCAPATLAALSNFWGVPADHLEIARLICYDGSPGHMERDWAEKAGWHVREFRLTWDVARALLDQGCPFSVVTVETESAHMQAVIGYDAVLQTLLVRDPYLRQFREWLAPEFFAAYSAHGPRSMILLPASRASLLAQIELPDAALYDQMHLLRRALHRHDRAGAEAAMLELRRLNPAHLLTHWSSLDLAQYDGRVAQALEAVQEIRRAYPDNNSWRTSELRLRERLGNPVEHRRLLQELGGRRDALPVFRREYAEELARDARNHVQAGRVLRSLLRRHGQDPKTLRAHANLLWQRREFSAATDVYRLTACVADKAEYHWDAFFVASRHLGRSDEALALLKNRVTRWGALSSQPARTLFDSLNALDRTPDAFAVLTAARALRPDDGELLLFYAEALTRYGRYEEAAESLAAASTRESRPNWLRAAARISDYRRDHRQALGYWRELVGLNPVDHQGHGAVARLLSITEGKAAAVDHLQQACRENPHLLPLHQALVTRLRENPAEQALEAVDRMLALDATDAWSWREKALIFRRLHRLEEALACADQAVLIAPHAPASHGIRADVLGSVGRTAEAHAEYAEGIRLSIDADWLFSPLVDTCPDFAARCAAVKFLHVELMRQPSLDNAALQFRATARPIVSTVELAGMLREYHAAHPDSWAAWSVLSTHYLETDDVTQALALARTATDQFPLVPRAWTDLAQAQARTGDGPAEILSIEKALAINPAWSQASRQLSTAHERQLQLDRAEHVLRRAVAMEPNDAANHGWLANILWRRRQPAEAIATMEVAVSLHPTYTWAWERLNEWCREQGDGGRVERLAQQLTETRAGEADSWLQLVRLRFDDQDITANLAALDRAAQLDPRDTEGWDLRVQLLARHRRYDEALASCRPPALGDPPPWNLQGRAAWIEACRGRHDTAIELMSALVQQHPDYRWGWTRLTEWYWEKKQYPDIQRCAEKWAWLEPNNGVPYGYLALVHLEAKHRPEAKAALNRSIAIDPLYSFGATELLKLYLEDSEFTEARQVLKHYETHYPPADSLRAEMRLHLATKDRAAATVTLRKMGALPGNVTEALSQTVHQLLETGWYSVVEKAMDPLLKDPAAQANSGDHWIAARRKEGLPWTTFWRLLRLNRAAPAGQRHNLLGSYVSWLGEDKLLGRLWCARWLWRQPLRMDPVCWGQTGYALITAGRFRAGVRWMRDWASRPTPPQGWMLHNLVLAFQTIGRPAEATVVLDAALRLPPDHVYEKLLIWRACEHALAGQTADAARLFDKINSSNLTKYYQSVLAVSRLLVDAQSSAPDQRQLAATDGLARLQKERENNPNLVSDRALRRIHRRALDQLARAAERPWLRLRSRLPMWTPSPARAAPVSNSGNGVPFWAIWVTLMLLSSIARSCSEMH